MELANAGPIWVGGFAAIQDFAQRSSVGTALAFAAQGRAPVSALAGRSAAVHRAKPRRLQGGVDCGDSRLVRAFRDSWRVKPLNSRGSRLDTVTKVRLHGDLRSHDHFRRSHLRVCLRDAWVRPSSHDRHSGIRSSRGSHWLFAGRLHHHLAQRTTASVVVDRGSRARSCTNRTSVRHRGVHRCRARPISFSSGRLCSRRRCENRGARDGHRSKRACNWHRWSCHVRNAAQKRSSRIYCHGRASPKFDHALLANGIREVLEGFTMRYEQFKSAAELWQAVPFAPIASEGLLPRLGFKLRATIRHLGENVDAAFLTYAPDIDTSSLNPIARDLVIVGKGHGSRCALVASEGPPGRIGRHILPDGRIATWGAGLPPTWKNLRPAWVSWASSEGQTCRVESGDILLQTLIDIADHLSSQPGG